ncbi:MAG: helix-turn-helix domain-containing protein [Okeania sp. SIO3I5]|uniref:helix-turn-helix domain-containing protein n=1 Tax=Okeania sp. SIO3I5 TaxID=2607805 RepID=UPI0013B8442E|nr:helix-turn-helix domain-containing protein [Okeania sp. SIO3I5]NEQ41854.1 helix-turn-helix domain-containing protein [Okeania sp. SIO3I5]
MLLKYKYKLKPHKTQGVIISNWLSMARQQYNYRLAFQLNWFEATRTLLNPCPLNVSVVGTFSWRTTFLRNAPQTLTLRDMKRIFVELGGNENANVRTTNLPRTFQSLGYKPLWGRKKDIFGNSITRKGNKHPNIINGYVAWEIVQLANARTN